MAGSREEVVTAYLHRGLARSEATRLAGMSRAEFSAALRRSPEFRKAVLEAESDYARRHGIHRVRQHTIESPPPISSAPGVYPLAVAVVPLLIGLLLLALGVPPGHVELSW